MAKNTILDWDIDAANNTDVGGIGTQGTNAVSNFDDALRTVMAQIKSGVDYKAVYLSKSANYTAVANDNNAIHRFTAAVTLALTAAATLGANWHYTVVADGGDVTIDPNGSETIVGQATLVVPNGTAVTIVCDGTQFRTVGALSVFGYGQKWTDVTASRTDGTTYFNTTKNPIFVNVTYQQTGAASVTAQLFVDGIAIAQGGQASTAGGATMSAIVPPGSSYKATTVGANTHSLWTELR